MKPTNDYDETVARPGGRMYDHPIKPVRYRSNLEATPEDMARWIELDDVAETSGVLSPKESKEYHRLANKYGWYVEVHYAGGTVDWTDGPTTQGEMNEYAGRSYDDDGYLPVRQAGNYAIAEAERIAVERYTEAKDKMAAAQAEMSPTGNFDPTPLNVEQTEKFQAYHAAPEVAEKHDSGKSCRPELIDPAFTKGVGRVLAFGANKYAAGNWAKGMEWSRLVGALERHILEFKSGNEIDPETGECHLYHAGCMLAFLASHWEHGLGHDDREEIGVMWPHSPDGTRSEQNGKV